MYISIHQVVNKSDLKDFINFPIQLYRNNDYYVPPLMNFELSSLSKDLNPAFDRADASYWLAKIDNVIVGRIAAIILDQELKEKSLARFGWIDFIDNRQVSQLLFEKAMGWANDKGATAIHGPLGFTDLDFEGALTCGYDKIATQATIYNYPYYIDHFHDIGMSVSANWVELRIQLSNKVPDRITRGASIVSNRFDLKVRKIRGKRDAKKYIPAVFDILNETYKDFYGYQILSQKQIDYYTKLYFGFIKKEYVCAIVNSQDDLVGFALSLPSISKALQKAKGKLFPIGFLHLLKDLYFNKHVDMFLIGVKPEYQKMGASALIFEFLITSYIKKGVKYVSTGPMLSDNREILNTLSDFVIDEVNISRSCFTKRFSNN